MRVSPIGCQTPVLCKQNRTKVIASPAEKNTQNITFKGGNLKFGDYLVGAICGGAMAVVGFAVAGPVGAIALGALGAKSTAEANNETRKND